MAPFSDIKTTICLTFGFLACVASPLNAQAPAETRGKPPTDEEAKKAPPAPKRIIVKTVRTPIEGFEEMTMVLRLPKNHKPDAPPARILAYCYHFGVAESVLERARNDNFFWNKFADKHGMATLSWNTHTLWKTRHSHDQVTRWTFMEQTREFDKVYRRWEAAMLDITRDHNLSTDNMLLYGSSRGAHFSMRMAMRGGSGRFSAVHANVPNSFEKPIQKGSGIVWLISNGDMDVGVQNARRFFQEALNQKYPIFIKAFRGLGHAENDESRKFSQSFFEYYLLREKVNSSVASELVQELKDPPFVGDFVNDLVFPVERINSIPESQRIPLPDEAFAKIWGRIIKR